MTVIGGVGHTLPFVIGEFQLAVIAAVLVVVIELGVISWSVTATWTLQRSGALQTGLGSVPVCLLGMFIGNPRRAIRDFGFWRRVLVPSRRRLRLVPDDQCEKLCACGVRVAKNSSATASSGTSRRGE
jgi:hypothetical protein